MLSAGSLDLDFGSAYGKIFTPVGDSTDIAQGVALQSDGKIVAAGYSFDGTRNGFAVVRYNADGSLDAGFDGDGKVITPVGDNGFAEAVAVQADGKIVVAGYCYAGGHSEIAVLRYHENGSLDSSFDGDGIALTSVGSSNDYCSAVVLQADGRILVAGYANNGTNNDVAVVRYNADGSLDTSFGGDGKVVTQVGNSDDAAFRIALQPDSKIVVAGQSYNGGNTDFAVVRYNADGGLDSSFDDDGMALTPIGSSNDYATGVAVQVDGRIVVSGTSLEGSDSDFAVVRYDADGELDTSFGSDGKVVTSLGVASDYASSLALQIDGGIVVAGSTYNGSNSDFALVRYSADGAFDAGFGDDGKALMPVGSSEDIAFGMSLQADGKIVLVGYSASNGNDDFAVVQFDSDGTLSNSFGGGPTDYKSIVTLGGDDFGQSVAVQPDGKVVVAGFSESEDYRYDFAMVRYNADGSLDTSFDEDGKVRTPGGIAYGIAVQPDGRIVLAGESGPNFAVARYMPDGSLDTSFGDDGKVLMSNGVARGVVVQPDGKLVVAGGIGNAMAVARYNTDGTLDNSLDGDGQVLTPVGSSSVAFGAALQTDGKIVVTGYSVDEGHYAFAIVRYNADGSLDTGFDGDGKQLTPVGTSAATAFSIALQADGKIVAAGGSGSNFALVRYNADGSLDSSFSGDGIALTPAANGGEARSVAVQPDGKIVAVGSAGSNFAVVRYNEDGSLDGGFDGDGKAVTSLGRSGDYGSGVVLQSNGKIVVAGSSYIEGNYNLAVVRYNHDGSLDTTAFPKVESRGFAIAQFGAYAEARTVAVQPDGKLVAAGDSHNNGDSDFALARFDADGSLDSGFDGDGKVLTPIGNSYDSAHSALVQPDGKIVVAGSSQKDATIDFAVVRYNADGSLDTSFDGDGKTLTPIGSFHDFGHSVALQSDSKLVVAGYAYNGSTFDVCVVRYNSDGSLDTSFDGDGKVITSVGGSVGDTSSVAIQADGKIVVAGSAINGVNSGFAVVRYNADGSLDPSFGGDGIAQTTIGSFADVAYSMAIQTDGKIVVVGASYTSNNNSDFAAVRYNTDGSLDLSFDGDGKTTTSVGPYWSDATSVALQADGKIVLAGTIYEGAIALVRYNSDGRLDTGFGDGGRSTDKIGIYSVGNAAALQGDGKIVVAGLIVSGTQYGMGIARFESADANVAPIADAGGPYSINEGGSISFDASGSSDPDGTIEGYTWDINGDGVFDDATGSAPTLTWAQLQALGINAGATYQVRVQVTDSSGEATTSSPALLTVVNTAPRLGPSPVTLGGLSGLHSVYSVPSGSGEQLRTVPVANIDSISIAFPEDVIVMPTDLTLTGANSGAHAFTGFVYNPLSFIATWSLGNPIEADALTLVLTDDVTDLFGAALDGEWDNPTNLLDPSSSSMAGNGIQGGDFVFKFTVLPGDASRDNKVTGADYNLWADNYGTPNANFEQGDFTGDGRLTPADYTIWADNFGMDLADPDLIVASALPVGVPHRSLTQDIESSQAGASRKLNALLSPPHLELEEVPIAMRRVAEQPVSRRRVLWREAQLASAIDEALLSICAESEPNSERHDRPWASSASTAKALD